jgi:DNA gyrase subunit A
MAQQHIEEVNISHEMKNSFMDYAMSVIVSRALPDVRDGLKPVHRRILYAMNELGMGPDKPYKKSARIVGEVIGKYHPHGDQAVYDTMVRMAQDFSFRYELIDGHGNFGSVDGDAPAAMRYTEARLSKIATELLRDINKNTIDFQDNYDGSEKEPKVLPARFPNLLVNGGTGIAVGMATNIPPHNLNEVIDGVLACIDNPEIEIKELIKFIQGPDFPTGGIILGREGIRKAYETGRGSITIRAKAMIEEMPGGKERIIVNELPFQVNKAKLIEKIAELVRDKKIDGITDLRDESDREGMRIVIELRRDANAQVILNNLFKQTMMQVSFGVNMLALVDGQPKILNIKSVILEYIKHQQEIVRRRSEYDLRKAEARKHIIDGLKKAIDIVDDLVDRMGPIRSAKDREEARQNLMSETFTIEGRVVPLGFTEEQANAILDMRLQQLTGLSIERLMEELEELIAKIAELQEILQSPERLNQVIKDELTAVKNEYGDARRTRITAEEQDIDIEDLIAEQEVVVTLTHSGYIKRLPADTYKSQRRGGRGVQGIGTRDDDFVEHLLTTNTHNTLLFFSNRGRVYRLKAYEVPEFSRTAKGIPIINLIQIEKGETIQAIIPIKEYVEDHYLFFATKNGIVKKTALSEFENIRKGGLFAITLKEDDELIGVRLTDGNQEIIMGTKLGMSIRFPESDVRAMGRAAAGVKGISLAKNDVVIDMDIVHEGATVLIVTENGYGKRTPIEEYRAQTRGGKGIKTLNVTQRNGAIVGLKVIRAEDDIMIITQAGVLIRLNVDTISTMGRYTQGVRLIRLDGEDQRVATVARVEKSEVEEE